MKIEVKYLNAMRLTKLLIAASRWLSRHADILNDLNVYPVPDGDTGTNMSMTLQAVENDLVRLSYEPEMNELCEIVSETILLGARGNSGTILSQIIQGFLDGLKGKEEVSVDDVIIAFDKAKEKAYKAVNDPVEGTMLTVIRMVSDAAKVYDGNKNDFIPFLTYLKNVAADAVEETPNLLNKLKEAGVVDAGGKGIYYILEGFEKSVTDPQMLEDLERIIQSQSKRKEILDANVSILEDIEYKYCTEFIIENGDFDLDSYKEKIGIYGNSMVCAQSSKKTKTHIHTNNPGLVFEVACKLGDLSHIKIDNMALQQHKNNLFENYDGFSNNKDYLMQNKNSKPVAFFAIVDNKELGEEFIKVGATAVLIGGQTKNPSVADIEKVLNKIEAETVYLLPNNKNIISAAKIVATRSNKEVVVVETKTMLEGHYIIENKDLGLEKITEQIIYNNSIEITKAVRDTKVDLLEIKEGDFIALINGKIKEKSKNLKELLNKIKENYISKETLKVLISIGKEGSNKDIENMENLDEYIKYETIDGLQENYFYYIYIVNRDPNLPEIALVTDSTSDLSKEMIKDLKNVEIIPLKVKLDGNNYYRDGVDISKEEFWKKLIAEGQLPKTSQPSPAEFKNLYEKLLNRGYKKIISLHISGKLSGTQQAARVGRSMLKRDKDVIIIDSKTVTFALGFLVTEAAKMAQKGKSLSQIIKWIEESKEAMKVYFVVKDLALLQKGGRVGKTSATIGGILKIKPILKMENGEIIIETKAIGEKGAMLHMEKLIKSSKTSIILYTGWGGERSQLSNADNIKNIAEKYKKVDYRGRVEIGAVIGSHVGAVYGMGIMDKIR